MKSFLLLFTFILIAKESCCLDNGVALTPPMGWLSWERFRCNTDCQNDPDNCISENLFKVQAQEMVNRGYLDAGYDTIIIDDCWLSHQRDADGKLQPDPERFPSGIKALADYVHSLGLKFGIYEDYGNFTCGGYPGILGHLQTDANTFAEWGVDYIKIDGCYVDTDMMDQGYPEFGQYLNQTKRHIVYSCSWPAYQVFENKTPDYASIAKHCNLWRNYGDIQDSWASVLDIINFYADDKDGFSNFAGPGHWNDPDMIIIGNFGLSLDQARAQMAMWAIFAAPLIMSNDLRTIRPEFEKILLNKNVLKINQDPLGIQGKRVFGDSSSRINIFVRPISPVKNDQKSAAVSVLNSGDDGTPEKVTFTPEQLGLNFAGGYIVSEVFSGSVIGQYTPSQKITVSVNPSGVVLLKFDLAATHHKKWWKWTWNDVEAPKSIEVTNMGLTGWKEL